MNRIAKLLADEAGLPMICDLSDELSHGVLVSNLAYRLAKELELPEDFCYHMSVAGMMHDVGKLEIWQYLHQDEDQRLEIERTRYTRTHPTLGYLRLLNEGFDPFVCEAVLHHHENYDGTGYPDNLKGEEIPLGARILRVCDVFAALVSDRPYRRAFSTETAMELLIDEVEHFDMWIFLAFQRVVAAPEFKEIHLLIKDYNEGYNRIRESARRQQIEGEESV